MKPLQSDNRREMKMKEELYNDILSISWIDKHKKIIYFAKKFKYILSAF